MGGMGRGSRLVLCEPGANYKSRFLLPNRIWHIHSKYLRLCDLLWYRSIDIASGAYSKQIGTLCIITNGTYIPRQSILEVLRDLPCKVMVRVDNYGKYSNKYEEVVFALKASGVPVDERNYNDAEQYLDGWVDLGDFEYKGYSSEQLDAVFRNCRMPDDCSILWDGKLYNCQYCVSGSKLGKIGMPKREIVDLFDNTTITQKRAAVRSWRDEPFAGCAYCNGFNTLTSPRIPAAEQL